MRASRDVKVCVMNVCCNVNVGYVLMKVILNVVNDFFFNDTATTEIYTLSLHDALPIYPRKIFRSGQKIKSFLKPPHIVANFMLISYQKTVLRCRHRFSYNELIRSEEHTSELQSHVRISYAVFCLKKKTKQQ